jgi:hypothetical protein
VDLDYKGLANTGTWFIGRLQTERDKLRLMEGLESAAGSFDRKGLEALLSGLGNRVFFMHNVHDDKPVLFQTRWALSFLGGPMTLPQIQAVMKTGMHGASTQVEAKPARRLPERPSTGRKLWD